MNTENLQKCSYTIPELNYTCNEIRLGPTDYCMFHNPNVNDDPETKDDFLSNFYARLDSANGEEKSLTCIGFYFRELRIRQVIQFIKLIIAYLSISKDLCSKK